MNQDEFVDRVRKHNDKVVVVGPYRGSRVPVEVRCRRCGRVYSARPDALLAGHGCGRCARLKTHEKFVEEVKSAHPDIEVVGRYVAAKQPIAVRCRKCGYEWSPRAQNLVAGHGCPKCRSRPSL